jgi:hypothetical protein
MSTFESGNASRSVYETGRNVRLSGENAFDASRSSDNARESAGAAQKDALLSKQFARSAMQHFRGAGLHLRHGGVGDGDAHVDEGSCDDHGHHTLVAWEEVVGPHNEIGRFFLRCRQCRHKKKFCVALNFEQKFTYFKVKALPYFLKFEKFEY